MYASQEMPAKVYHTTLDADAVADEELLRDHTGVERMLREFGVDDIFNAKNNDVNPHNIDSGGVCAPIIEECFESEECIRETEPMRARIFSAGQHDEPVQKPASAAPCNLLSIDQQENNISPQILGQINSLLNQLSEQSVFDVGLRLA